MAIQSDTAVRFRKDVHINDGGDRTEVLGHADADVWPLAVDVIVAQRYHCLLLTSYCVGAKVSIINLFCKETKGDRETEKVGIKNLVLRFHNCKCSVFPSVFFPNIKVDRIIEGKKTLKTLEQEDLNRSN